jgi:hypothetical protein
MRLISIRPFPLLQICYIGIEIPLELCARKHGYDVIGAIFIGEIVAGRVVHPWHAHMFVTRPLVTDPATRGVSHDLGIAESALAPSIGYL